MKGRDYLADTDILYENAGELTRSCLDDILKGDYSFFDDENNYTEEYLLEYNFKTFSDGLTDCIIRHDYNGNVNSANEKATFIKNKCNEKNIDLNSSVVKTWFTDKRPISSERSRENVYKLCFALGLTVMETSDFFLKVYYECPFNFRIYEELIYYYCLNNGQSYSSACNLINKAKVILENSKASQSVYELTTGIETDLKNIHTDDELLKFISQNNMDFLITNQTACHHAKRLIDECTELAKNDCQSREELHHKLGRSGNIALLIYVLFGEDILDFKKDKSFSKASEFPELVKSNFPLKMNLSRIKNGQKVSYETMRKSLILLSFYSYYAQLFQNADYEDFCALEEDFTDFVCETNDLLKTCGYPSLYVRNPFDWLIMHCGSREYPLDEFRNAINRYYLDHI